MDNVSANKPSYIPMKVFFYFFTKINDGLDLTGGP